MASDTAAIDRLQESVVDGRTENGRYRQDQLQRLHRTLREEASQIIAALVADSRSPSAEVDAEFYLGMEAIRHFSDSLDFEKDLKEEYNVVRGQDNPARRVGAGLVVIRPTTHTRFYSIVTPLAAAIAAGNCIILEVSAMYFTCVCVLRVLINTRRLVAFRDIVASRLGAAPSTHKSAGCEYFPRQQDHYGPVHPG